MSHEHLMWTMGPGWHEGLSREELVGFAEHCADRAKTQLRNNTGLRLQIDRNNEEIAILKGHVRPETPEPKRTVQDVDPMIDWARVAVVKTGPHLRPWRLEFDGAEIWEQRPHPTNPDFPMAWGPVGFRTKTEARASVAGRHRHHADRASTGQLALDTNPAA